MQVLTLGRYGRFAPPNCATSGYLLRGETGDVIVDFGSGCMGQSLKYTDFCRVSAIILSHLHYDHMSDLYTLGYYLAAKNLRVKLYCPSAPKSIVESLRQFNYDIVIYGESSFNLGEFNFKAITAKHTTECYSLIVNDLLLYTADIQSFDNLMPIVASLKAVIGDACILECNHTDSSPHISVKMLAESIPTNVQLYLAHLSYGDEARILSEALSYHEMTEIVPEIFEI